MTAHNAIVQAIPVDQIEVASFVRTSNGYDRDSLRDLADSIKEHGLIQPIVVRPKEEGEGASHAKFAIVAGRRRLAACKLAGLGEVPALVTDTDESKAYELEIVENIQREDMTTYDTARAVRTLFMIHGSSKAVQRIVNKSSAWVSKHLSVTADAFPVALAELMAEGMLQDLETLLILAQIAKLPATAAMSTYTKLLQKAQSGELGRAEAKAALESLKGKIAAKTDLTNDGEVEGDSGAGAKAPKEFKPSREQVLALIDQAAANVSAAIQSINGGNPIAARLSLGAFLADLEEARRKLTGEPASPESE